MLWNHRHNPPNPHPGPPGYTAPVRAEGLPDVTAPSPSLAAVRAAIRYTLRANRLDRVIYGPPVVHKTPLGGIFSHPPGGQCETCDALLDVDP